MYYSYTISVPANTTFGDRQKQVLELAFGVATQLEVVGRPGAAGLLCCRILCGRHQVWPSNSDEHFRLDRIPIKTGERYELSRAPYTLTLESWNLDDTYVHAFTIRLTVLPYEALGMELPRFARIRGALQRLVGSTVEV